jgi:hypothetical protein
MPNASPLMFTDRSRLKTGLSRCPRARYLGYHAGPTGYGMTARSEALPLVTGIAVHQVLEACALILQKHDRLPDLDEMLRIKFLPWLHQTYRVVKVEEERLHMLGDDKAIMLRTDLLAQRRGGQSLAYFEAKTTGWGTDAWAEQWETDAQLALGTVDARELWGAEVTETFIIGLFKGGRQKDRYGDSTDERKKQQSPLCYGYCRPANPPLQSEDWLPSYEWTDADGTVKRASRAHRRKGVWTLEDSDWSTWRAYQAQDPGLTATEFWTRMLPASLLEKICFILGPMNPQAQQLQAVLRGFQGEEERWQQTLWSLYAVQQHGHDWASDEFQAALDRLVPCSWACRPFGKEHQCEFVRICHRHTGWQDPMTNGFQPRLPHHAPELEQAIARGLLPEQAETVEEEE